MLQELYNNIEFIDDFPKEGIRFANILPLLNNPILRDKLRDILQDSIPEDVDVIVAPEVRGMLLAYILTDYTVVPVRKKGKLPGEVISVTYDTEYSTDTLECRKINLEGKNCWFIDDIFATGGTYKAVRELITQLGGNLLGGSVLLDVLGKKDSKIVEVFSNFS